jgi:hypothetical protein
MNPTLQLLLQLIFLILAAISAAFSGLMFFTLRDLRDRIMRLETQAMHGTGSAVAYRRVPGAVGQQG